MSTDPIGASLTLDHPALSADAPRSESEQSSELTGIVTAIERVEALLASVGSEAEGSDALERIADIAFVLHERDVEASLCDALDAAVRELGNANGAKQTNERHVRQAAELLRELSQRVGDMIALLQASPPSEANGPAANIATPEQSEPAPAEQSASTDTLDSDIPREGLFTAEALKNDAFARSVAELAASLPALAAPVEAVIVTLHQPTDPAPDELTPEAEPQEAVIGAQDESDDLVVSELPAAPEPPDAFLETQSRPDELVTQQLVLPHRLEETAAEASAEPQDDLAEPLSDKASLEQQPPAMFDPLVGARELGEELSKAEAIEGAREDETFAPHPSAEPSIYDVTVAAVPASESEVSETLSPKPLVRGAGIPAQPADLPCDLPDSSLMNRHTALSQADGDTAHIPSVVPSPAPPESAPEGETALPPDNSPLAALSAHSGLPPAGDVSGPPADAALQVGTGGEESAPVASDALSHDADEAVAETAAQLEGGPPPCAVNSSQALLLELALVDPQDDPGDLFEPQTGEVLPIAGSMSTSSQSASEISARTPAMRASPAAAASDPVAAMRMLGAEEILALFT